MSDENVLARRVAEEHASVLAGLTPQTIVMTRKGEMPVEWLEIGDELLTRDRGFVPILWMQRTKLTRKELRDFPQFAPSVIKASSIAPNVPKIDLFVSPRQLVLVRSALAELNFASSEVLLPARSVGEQLDPETLHWAERISYAHILLPSHQLLIADDLSFGTLFTGELGTEVDMSNCTLVRKLDAPRMQAARPILTEEEGRMLMHEIWEARAAEDTDLQEDQAQIA